MTDPNAHDLPLTPVCAIGASAGGVTALQSFFAHIDDGLGLAYVVIVHLAPDQPSSLAEILSTRTSMPVRTVQDTATLQPNCVYVIPPDRELVIEREELTARPFTEPRGRRSPIDMFFNSIAAARGDGIAVVLSGSGSDGALGVRAIKAGGGVIFVQDPNEAEYAVMPQAAIGTGVADFVAPIARLAVQIAEVVDSKEAIRKIGEQDSEGDLRKIIALLRRRTGHDFSSYKRPTILRRVARRMQVTRQDDLGTYAAFLQANPEEAKELFSDLLISVTSFFRDPATFQTLAQTAVAPIFEKLDGDAPIRVWVVGCATGEEAYSIGMVLLEEAARRSVYPSIQIFASDLDEAALAVAREGRYPKAIENDVSEERLRRFFVEESGAYRVKKELRDIVLFSLHSALKDPPFIKLDLISCRNLLIYLQRDLQRQLCTLFHYALKPDGYLFLGTAETVDAGGPLFRVVDRDARIYAPVVQSEKIAPILPQLSTDHRIRAAEPKNHATSEVVIAVGQAHAAALERYAPPSVLIDRSQRILHISPNASLFFRPMEGPFSPELTAQVCPELRVDLKLALQRLFEDGQSTLTLPIAVGFNGNRRLVSVHVTPALPSDGGVGGALVLFLDAGETPENGEAPKDEDINREEVTRLRKELSIAQDRVSASRKEHEISTQELRAANEELQSINEEYRSTAEELETSKEELQSMNEELQTVNSELKSKLEAISSAHNDLQNLIVATEIGTLFLDADLKIRLFTPIVASYFNITSNDIGRRITDYTNLLDYRNLEQDAANVLRTLTPLERGIATKTGQWLMLGLRPYRTLDERIDGVVLTLTDITSRKAVEAELQRELDATKRLQQLNARIVQSKDFTQPLSEVLKAVIELVGADFGSIALYDEKSKSFRLAAHQGFERPFLDRFQSMGATDLAAGSMALNNLQQVFVPDIEKDSALAPVAEEARAAGFRSILSTPLLMVAGKVGGVLSVHFREPHEITARDSRYVDICARYAADALNAFNLQRALRDDDRRKNAFLAILAHELRNPLAPISNALQTLRRLKPGAPETPALFDMIGRQVEHLSRLITDLLDVSRITQGKIDLRPELLDLNDVVRRVLTSSAPAIEGKGHKLSATLLPKPLPVFGDPVRLAQVFGNLVSNAIKYTPNGGRIEVSTTEANGDALVTVRDNGVGVSPDMLSQIFELFVQAEQDPKNRQPGGMGVGLALARSLVSFHGGTIEAHSDGLGKGCEFVVRLPVRVAALTNDQADDGRQAGDGRDEKEEPFSSPQLAPQTLVVDDNVDVANGLVSLLKTLGAEVRVVYNAADALDALGERKPDLAIVDLGMPGMDGYELARAMRMKPEGKDLLLVALTGWGDDDHRKRGGEAGFDRYFIKPIEAGELKALLAEAAERRNGRESLLLAGRGDATGEQPQQQSTR